MLGKLFVDGVLNLQIFSNRFHHPIHFTKTFKVFFVSASLNEVHIALNGRLLPADLLCLNDLGYRLIRGGAVGPYGFVYGYELTPDYYPEVGRNTIEITLVRRDPNISLPFAVHDIDCQVRYRRHRNFARTPTGHR